MTLDLVPQALPQDNSFASSPLTNSVSPSFNDYTGGSALNAYLPGTPQNSTNLYNYLNPMATQSQQGGLQLQSGTPFVNPIVTDFQNREPASFHAIFANADSPGGIGEQTTTSPYSDFRGNPIPTNFQGFGTNTGGYFGETNKILANMYNGPYLKNQYNYLGQSFVRPSNGVDQPGSPISSYPYNLGQNQGLAQQYQSGQIDASQYFTGVGSLNVQRDVGLLGGVFETGTNPFINQSIGTNAFANLFRLNASLGFGPGTFVGSSF